MSLAALDGISDYAATAQAENTFHTYHADQPGIVVYSTDGYEGVTTDTFQSSMFDEASYDRTDGQRALQIAAGAPLYKLITSEYWSLVIPIGSDLAKRLADDDTLQLRFMKDNTTTYATYTITEKEGSTYLILTLRSGMVRYAKDRYAEVELLLSEETGLKIPNSSITEKEFYTVPKDFFMKGGDSGSLGILVQRSDSSGKAGAGSLPRPSTMRRIPIITSTVRRLALRISSERRILRRRTRSVPARRACRAFIISIRDMPSSNRSTFSIRMRNTPSCGPGQPTELRSMTI